MRPIASIAAVAILAGVVPAAAISFGTAQGTLLAGGERYELTKAYAVHRGSVFESGGGGKKTITLVRLVDGEIDAASVADDKKFAKALVDGNLHAVEVELSDDSGEITAQRIYHGGKRVDGPGGDAGTWLRGEFNNKQIWGALGTDGVQPLGTSGFWRFEAFFAAQFEAPPGAALEQNTAQGSMKLGGKTAKLVAARSWLDTRTPEGGEEDTYTIVVLSSAPLDLDTVKDDQKLLAAVKKQKLQAFKIEIHDQDGNVTRQGWFSPAGVEQMEAQEGLRWASWEFSTDSISGFLTSDGDRQAGKTKWAIESHFNAAIEGAPAE